MSDDELQRLKAKNNKLEKENKQLREKIKMLSAKLFSELQNKNINYFFFHIK